MSIETIQNFLTLPEFPDIISYIILIGIVIGEYFLKKFVQRDNRTTLYSVDTKTKKLDDAISNFEKKTEELEKERKKIRKEFNLIKKAIKKEANNSHELVANGTAHEVSTMLDEYLENMEEEDVER